MKQAKEYKVNCAYCKNEFKAKRIDSRYCEKHRKPKDRQEIRTVSCAYCGDEFKTGRSNARYCEKHKGWKNKSGKIRMCEICGKDYTEKGSMVMCPDCRKEEKKYKAPSAGYNTPDRRNYHSDRLDENIKKANEAGLSYGNYIAQLYLQRMNA